MAKYTVNRLRQPRRDRLIEAYLGYLTEAARILNGGRICDLGLLWAFHWYHSFLFTVQSVRRRQAWLFVQTSAAWLAQLEEGDS